jgi:hypothetical protein
MNKKQEGWDYVRSLRVEYISRKGVLLLGCNPRAMYLSLLDNRVGIHNAVVSKGGALIVFSLGIVEDEKARIKLLTDRIPPSIPAVPLFSMID